MESNCDKEWKEGQTVSIYSTKPILEHKNANSIITITG
jgi:hypothetical protein